MLGIMYRLIGARLAFKDWLNYIIGEIRNPDKNIAGFEPGELTAIEVNDKLTPDDIPARRYDRPRKKGRSK